MWQGGVGALSLALLAKTNTKDQYTWITFLNDKTIIIIFLITTHNHNYIFHIINFHVRSKMIEKTDHSKDDGDGRNDVHEDIGETISQLPVLHVAHLLTTVFFFHGNVPHRV